MTRFLRLYGIEANHFTGAGVIQRELARRLPALVEPDWRVDQVDGTRGLIGRLAAGGGIQADASLWVSTPLPIRVPSANHSHFVFDLRWRTTRSWLAGQYRGYDLRRILRHANHVFTISDHVASQITAFAGQALPLSVVPLGPGQVEGRPRVALRDTRTIFMIGRARHKRNEELARMLCRAPGIRASHQVIAVNVSDETRSELAAFGTGVEVYEAVDSDVLGSLLDRSSVYVALSVDEGFGLPYVEAAYCGCDVVAIDAPVSREAVGPEAIFLDPHRITPDSITEAVSAWDRRRVGLLVERSRARSWAATAQHVAARVVPSR